MTEQITLEEYLQSRRKIFPTCGDCVCRSCLYWWSSRCPYGGCRGGDFYPISHCPHFVKYQGADGKNLPGRKYQYISGRVYTVQYGG